MAGGGPENVVVVVNAQSDSSKLIANHYRELRGIPVQNLVYLDKVPRKPVIRLEVFRDEILRPLFAELSSRKLINQIDYIVYSTDFPTRINFGTDRNNANIPQGQLKIYNFEASINSITYFSSAVFAKQSGYMGLNANNYMRTSARMMLQLPFEGEELLAHRDGVKKFSDKDFDGALEVFKGLEKKFPTQVAIHYWLARTYAMLGDKTNALESLKAAVRTGWSYQEYTTSDKAFERIAGDPEFNEVVQTIPDQEFQFVPTRGFRSRYSWGKNGMVNGIGRSNQGRQYMLSTVLGVTGTRGQTESEIVRNLSLSVGADGSNPTGKFYFTKTKDVRSKTRLPKFEYACKELRELGYEAEIISAPIPKNQKQILGLTMGASKFDWERARNTIVPGAICENLTSYGGRFAKHGQTLLTELLNGGAAGSSGTVIEPYAIQAKFPDPRIHVHYAKGCSLAEAFYQSVHGPFQLLIVGDALCQPFAVFPKFQVNGVSPGDEVSGAVSLRLDYSNSPVPIAGIEIYSDGVLVNRSKPLSNLKIPTTEMSDGYHEIRIVAIAQNAIETSGRVVLPFYVNNSGKEVVLSASSKLADLKDKLRLSVTANCGEKISLWHNGRKVGTKAMVSGAAEFELAARVIGRGQSQVFAMVEDDKKTIWSRPVSLEIGGKPMEVPQQRAPVESKRFSAAERSPNVENARQLIFVRQKNGGWEFDSNNAWQPFQPVEGDVLVAKVDFARDRISALPASSKDVGGLETGIGKSDLKFLPNFWDGKSNAGEFGISGTYFTRKNGQRVAAGEFGKGIAATDNNKGIGYLMYSVQNIHERFAQE